MITDKILRKIKAKKRGWVFCAKDFHDLGTRNAIDKALSRMADDSAADDGNKIIRVIRGIYYYPIIQDGIGIIPPNLDDVANAIARNSGISIYPSGATSANMLGLSNQVPSQNIYWTHGKSMTKQIGKNSIIFKHIRTNPVPNVPSVVMIVLNALSYIGKNKIDDTTVNRCSRVLSDSDKKYLQKMSPKVAGWVANFIPQIIAA
jgi:Family of unknown function (DUF6088)